IQSADGESFSATVVRVDAKRGLALLRVRGVKMHYLNLADAFDGGPVQCLTVTRRSLFSIEPAAVAGVVESPRGEAWTVQLDTAPALPGAPLTRDGRVIGVVRGGDDATRAAAIPLAQIRGFLGSDVPKTPSRFRLDARSSVYQV